MSDDEILMVANAIAKRYHLRAELLPGIFSVGVGGDQRTYTPVLVLIGPHPGNETLASLSTMLGNVLPVNRVTYELGGTYESP